MPPTCRSARLRLGFRFAALVACAAGATAAFPFARVFAFAATITAKASALPFAGVFSRAGVASSVTFARFFQWLSGRCRRLS